MPVVGAGIWVENLSLQVRHNELKHESRQEGLLGLSLSMCQARNERAMQGGRCASQYGCHVYSTISGSRKLDQRHAPFKPYTEGSPSL